MTKEELAILMNGRDYADEISDEEEKEAQESGLIVLFCYSDDALEVRGAISDELLAYSNTEYVIAMPGDKIPIDHDGSICYWDADHLQVIEMEEPFERIDNTFRVTYHSSGIYTWMIESRLPHSVFEILEDENPFCRGIIIDVKDLIKSTKPIDLIAAERARQISEKNHSLLDDDQLVDGELAEAASIYATKHSSVSSWPWKEEGYKPTPDNRIKQLVKAGALIVAEIERLQRLEIETTKLAKFIIGD